MPLYPPSTPPYGLYANRPSAASAGDKALYVATDVDGGALYQVQSAAWVRLTRSYGSRAYARTTLR